MLVTLVQCKKSVTRGTDGESKLGFEEFSLIPAPAPVSPNDGDSNVSLKPTLDWDPVDGADSYILHVSISDQMVIEKQENGTDYTSADELMPDETYYWRVRAVMNGNKGKWSSIESFSTKAGDDNSQPSGSVSADRRALLDLYEATGGDSWHNNSGWGSGDPSDSWHGIETDANGRVVRIDLFDNGLSGHLPESIGNLTNVRYLNVKKNKLTGEIPRAIGDMASLEWLILAGRTYEVGGTLKEPPQDINRAYHPGKRYSNTNDFEGVIPSTIGQLSNLERLELANQPNIKGSIPSEIGNLSKLEGLYLSFNDFSGTRLPSSIGRLTNLKQLYIASAQLEGDIPSGIENLTQLRHLNLGESSSSTPDNHLTGEIPDFSQFHELRGLVITDNNLTGEYPKYWNNGNFTQLITLRFSWNNLTGTLHGFDNLPSLRSFGVDGNELTGGLDITGLDPGVILFTVGWNNLSGTINQSSWPDFYQLRVIRLNDNNFTGDIPCEFWSAIDNPDLKKAAVENNNWDNTCFGGMNAVLGGWGCEC